MRLLRWIQPPQPALLEMRKGMQAESAKTEVVVIGSHVQGMFMRVPHFPVADETVLAFDFREALDGGKGSHQAIA